MLSSTDVLYSASTLYRFDTEYSADSCEFNPHLNVLATGTYQVNKLDPESESPQTERLGRIYIHNLDIDSLEQSVTEENGAINVTKENGDNDNETKENGDNFDTKQNGVTRSCSLECPAVLDMKWNLKSGEVLAAVNASGQLALYHYDQKENILIGEGQGKQISEGLALALEWNISYDNIVVSDSKGKVRVLDPEKSLEVLNEYSGHGYEAWTCCFSAWDDNLIYSGGDDCCFNCYDLRVDSAVLKKNTKSHNMGVTAMISDRCQQNQIITGSYDEKLRWWDERNLKYEVQSLQVDGGVWRIKQRPSDGRLLIGAMHGGFCVVINNEVVAKYDEHQSLAYGADWITDSLAASASFYDHLMTIWSIK